jgi:hypothetical protein
MALPSALSSAKLSSPDDLDISPLYPASIQELDKLHWSPLSAIRQVTDFLAGNCGDKVLDIGSGAGKFCLTAAYLKPATIFYGVEQRENLVGQANIIRDLLDIQNVEFIHKNFTQLDLRKFNGFYFYNSFFENLPNVGKIDDSIDYSTELYRYYSLYLQKQLDGMPFGTKVASYCSWDDEIPPGYLLADSRMEGLLKFWVKA